MGTTAESPISTGHHKLPSWQHISCIARRTDIRVWAALFVALAGIFLWADRAEIGRTARSLRAADPWWLAGLILFALVIQWLFALFYVQLLRLTRHRVPICAVAEAQLQRHAVATVMPVGIAPATVLFVRKLKEHGVPEDDSLLSLVLFSTLGHSSLVIYAIPVLLWLALHQGLPTLFVMGIAALSLVAAAVLALTLFLLRASARQSRFERKLPSRFITFVSAAKVHQIGIRSFIPPSLTALAIDGVGIAMLFAALQAVGERPSIGVAVAGYVVGTIFLVLSPAFQGLGLVEVSIVVVLERLGISRGHAASATLLFRAGELWLPLALGIAVQARMQPRLRGAPASLPALMTAFTGLMSVASVIAPTIPRHLNRVEDYSLLNPTDASRTLSLVGGFILLFLSYALWRRRRVAWLACLALSAVVALAHLFMAHDRGVALVVMCNLALLLVYRRRFSVRSDVPTLRRGLVGFGASLLFALAYGTVGFWFLDGRQFGTSFSIDDSLAQTTRLFFSLGNAGLHPRTRYADWYLDSISIIGVTAAVVATLSLIRPVVWRRRTLPQERLETRSLIDRYGDSSLDYFKSTPDKYFFFSSSRDAVAAYGVSSATAVVLGDPVAANETAFTKLLSEMMEFAEANAWQLAFHQVPPQRLDAYRAAGFETLMIGEEAIVDVQHFSLSGNGMKSLRSSVNRLVKAGYSTQIHEPPHEPDFLSQLRTVSKEWLTLPGRRERSFTLGKWDDEYINHSRVVAVQNEIGDVVALVNLIPSGVAGEATFDLMRHLPAAPSGSMDFLLARLIQYLRAEGFERLSLGMVPWSAVGGCRNSTLLERGVGMLTPHLGRFFASAGLRAYKAKFNPQWEPRYLVYSSEAALPQIALAIVRLTEQGDRGRHVETTSVRPSTPIPSDTVPLASTG
jgi:phosphatidylglycerol lysyltransferase